MWIKGSVEYTALTMICYHVGKHRYFFTFFLIGMESKVGVFVD